MNEIKHMIWKTSQGIGIIGIIAMLLELIFIWLALGEIITWSPIWVLYPIWIYGAFKVLLIIAAKCIEEQNYRDIATLQKTKKNVLKHK